MAMLGQKLFEEVSAKVSETIANSPAKDVEKNVKAMLGRARTTSMSVNPFFFINRRP